MKARHKWSKEISEIEFIFDENASKGTVFWLKRKELLLKSGAKLNMEPQINKDGSLNFSAKFAKALRLEHQSKIKDDKTTADIIFPSPNELGIFMRFGGDNSWLSLKDSSGKTLDEWSKIDQ